MHPEDADKLTNKADSDQKKQLDLNVLCLCRSVCPSMVMKTKKVCLGAQTALKPEILYYGNRQFFSRLRGPVQNLGLWVPWSLLVFSHAIFSMFMVQSESNNCHSSALYM